MLMTSAIVFLVLGLASFVGENDSGWLREYAQGVGDVVEKSRVFDMESRTTKEQEEMAELMQRPREPDWDQNPESDVDAGEYREKSDSEPW